METDASESSSFEFKIPSLLPLRLTDEAVVTQPLSQQVSPDQAAAKKPDYVLNPHKWKKYTLEDVPEAHMSPGANFQAAFSFLNNQSSGATTNKHRIGNARVKVSCDVGHFERLADTASSIEFNKPIGAGRMCVQRECRAAAAASQRQVLIATHLEEAEEEASNVADAVPNAGHMDEQQAPSPATSFKKKKTPKRQMRDARHDDHNDPDEQNSHSTAPVDVDLDEKMDNDDENENENENDDDDDQVNGVDNDDYLSWAESQEQQKSTKRQCPIKIFVFVCVCVLRVSFAM